MKGHVYSIFPFFLFGLQSCFRDEETMLTHANCRVFSWPWWIWCTSIFSCNDCM